MVALIALVAWQGPAQGHAAPLRDGPADIPTSGVPVPELAAFDLLMTSIMTRWALPGGQLAIATDGRLVFNHAYGYADRESGQAAQPDSLFRLASVSKPFTGVAILTLIQDGNLKLDDRAFRILSRLQPAVGAAIDPRLDEITIQNLLQHAGGWDSSTSFDPQYPPFSLLAAQALGIDNPPSCASIIRFMLGEPLDFTPGTRAAYSNFGYCVFGRVIEQVSGMRYEQYVQTQVLAPPGITDMRIGGTLLSERFPNEVKYYGPPGQAPRVSVYPGEGYVPFAYGGYYMPALDAHGGWIATAADLVRFAVGVDGQRPPALLSAELVQAMLYTPLPQAETRGDAGAGNAAASYGLAWVVQRGDAGATIQHAGALEDSTAAFVVRDARGVPLAFTFNSLPDDYSSFFSDVIPALPGAVAQVNAWPSGALFTR